MNPKRGNSTDSYWPSAENYHHGLSREDWRRLIEQEKVFDEEAKKVMHMFLEQKGESTFFSLAKIYGRDASYYYNNCLGIAEKVYQETDCILWEGKKEDAYWPILFQRRTIQGTEGKASSYRIRPELKRALKECHLPDTAEALNRAEKHYWWLNANPRVWRFSEIEIGAKVEWTLYNQNKNKRRIFQNFLNAKEGNYVIGYESSPVKQIAALLRVCKESDGESIFLEKVENLSCPIELRDFKDLEELQNMEYLVNPQGSLFKLTETEHSILMDLIREQNPLVKGKRDTAYTKKDFLNQVYWDSDEYDALVSLIRRKKNIILQGAPGVGKTFAAKRLAYAIMGYKEEERIHLIQFHQSYSYEDFVMGYRPNEDGFKLESGSFYKFCKKAENNPEQEYFFIIDEINRGNISRIFGELLMLIESDKRGERIHLAYNEDSFMVPKNLYIIGMMNTADRSLAVIDYALRRRFGFYSLKPAFHKTGFRQYQKKLNSSLLDKMVELIQELNIEIKDDAALGEGFVIGHSYFCAQKSFSAEWMRQVIEYEIVPVLEEYWFDDSLKVSLWRERLCGALDE